MLPRRLRARRPAGLRLRDQRVDGVLQTIRGRQRLVPRGNDAIRAVLTDPEEVWLVAERRRGRVVYRRRFLAAFDDDLVGVVQEEKDGGLAWTFYPGDRVARRDPNDNRRGFLLYRRRGG